MTDRQQLLDWIEEERDAIVGFFRDFVREPTPNPPGITTGAVAHITRFLEAQGAPWRLVAPQAEMPNVVGTIDGPEPGRHLVLNGHIDVFPVGEDPAAEGWTRDPWGGEIAGGRLYGRGSSDMKAGTSASVWTYVLLNRLRDRLKGRLTLTCVSDEETFGPWGARWLMEHEPEVLGDCCLNGEPSSPFSVRYGEKGLIWLKFTVRTKGAHGAYTHASPSATRLAMRLIRDLETLEDLEFTLPDNLLRAQLEAGEATDRAMGPGASTILPKVTLNIGTIRGGLKNNMVPHTCVFDADIRLPVGLEPGPVLEAVEGIAARHPHATFERENVNPPSWCDPYGEMMEIIRRNVVELGRPKPTPIVSIGGTDARLWRHAGIPAYVYGPFPEGMGSSDENVPVEDYLHIVRTHVLSAYDYLMAG